MRVGIRGEMGRGGKMHLVGGEGENAEIVADEIKANYYLL